MILRRTHFVIYAFAAINQACKLPRTPIIKTNQAGSRELLDWAYSSGILERVGIEENKILVLN